MTYDDLGAPEYIDSVRTDAAAITATLRHHGGSAAVPHCPGWTVRDVVAHLGGVHRWATDIVRTHEAAADRHPTPDGDLALADWFDQGTAELCAVLAATAPDTPCWTFGMPPSVAGLWRRRQALETAVHRFDVEHAVRGPVALPTDLAAAGVTEVVEFLYPRQVMLHRAPEPSFVITLVARDTGDRWTVGTGGPSGVITGAARDLLLMLWRRPHEAVSTDGDDQALAGFAGAALVP